jgi:protoheme IX farnesyltransferase
MTSALKLVYHTAKVRLGFLIMACTIAGVAVSPGGNLGPWQVAILGISTLLASAAAGAFNQYYERDLDGAMRRTKNRPFVTGELSANRLWPGVIVASLAIAVAAAALATNWLAALYVFLGAFTYGVVYTVWLKRRTWLNIVIGGLAGSFAVMAGSAAVGATLETTPLILAVVLFLWTPPHFWALAFACREDYRAAGVPMLPVVTDERTSTRVILVHALAVVGMSLVPLWHGMGWIYLSGAVAGGAYFLLTCTRLVLSPAIANAWRAFGASIAQLGLLLTAAILDSLLLT